MAALDVDDILVFTHVCFRATLNYNGIYYKHIEKFGLLSHWQARVYHVSSLRIRESREGVFNESFWVTSFTSIAMTGMATQQRRIFVFSHARTSSNLFIRLLENHPTLGIKLASASTVHIRSTYVDTESHCSTRSW
ncbi:hypothetical protein E1B28_002293 [Marasmius oreades]|uniref:Uncharacterized protein n=1 Tax=Marasmius oreades TaxID=181124 RepID=A0A9P7ULF1_9AGAR|nr:uncharacterized protein E1B28_002293 [Marasmius oreades]KAG7086330.1 hypothetical protein E1B28_002293 [Marasmius oreades]